MTTIDLKLSACHWIAVCSVLASCAGTSSRPTDSGGATAGMSTGGAPASSGGFARGGAGGGAGGGTGTGVDGGDGSVADASPPNPLDAGLSASDGVPADGMVIDVGAAGRDGAGREASPAVDAVADTVDGPAIVPDAGDAGVVCTPAQEAQRSANTDPMPFASLPSSVQDFLLSFLSRSYIDGHFRFYPPQASASNVSYFDFVDGCFTVQGGFVEWGVPLCQGKTRFVGPAKEYRILVDETQARQISQADGCDWADARLEWNSMDPASIPAPRPDTCDGFVSYPAWHTGGQTLPADPGLPAGSYCMATSCTINAETAAASVTPKMCASRGGA